MKIKYKTLVSIIAIEFLCISLLSKSGYKAQTWLGNVIGILIFLAPIQFLLYQLSKDDSVSAKKQMLFKGIFWFIWVSYLLGGVASLF